MARRPRLLVVEDDPAVLSLFVAYLEKDGYHVTGAATGGGAETLLKRQPFDLVLLDLGLPDEDGLVVARRIRAGSTVPLVLVTHRADDADKIAGLELDADDYITKPFNPRELSARVRNILARTDTRSRQVNEDVVRFVGPGGPRQEYHAAGAAFAARVRADARAIEARRPAGGRARTFTPRRKCWGSGWRRRAATSRRSSPGPGAAPVRAGGADRAPAPRGCRFPRRARSPVRSAARPAERTRARAAPPAHSLTACPNPCAPRA